MQKSPINVECVPAADVLTDAVMPDIKRRFRMFAYVLTETDFDELLVVRQDEKLIGLVGFQDFGNTLYLNVIEVDEAHRKQGIAAALSDHFHAMALERGLKPTRSEPASAGGRALAARLARLAAASRTL